jgi:hypothetical protein
MLPTFLASIAVTLAVMALRLASKPAVTVINVTIPQTSNGKGPSLPEFINQPEYKFLGGSPHVN